MAASDGPARQDTNFAPTFLIVCGIFTVIATGLCGVRIYSRLRLKPSLRAEDYLILVPMVLCVANFAVAIVNSVHGWGHLSLYVSKEDRVVAFKCLFIQQLLWILAAALIRVSVATSLLRLSTWTAWRWTLWVVIGMQIIIYIGHMIFLLGNCRPLPASWQIVPGARCWDQKYVFLFGWVANSLVVVIDFILALMPVQLIRTLNRSSREKILICCLMATGLFAAAVAAYKMSLSKSTFARTSDLLSTSVNMSLWNRMEALLGIIAACLPSLKAPAERLLRRIGFLTSRLEMTTPSFVVSLKYQRPRRDRESRRFSADSSLVDSVHIDPESGKKESGTDKIVSSTVEVDD